MQRAPRGPLHIATAHHHWPAFTPPHWPGIRPPLTGLSGFNRRHSNVTSFHTASSATSHADPPRPLWQPVCPPRRGAGDAVRSDFHAYTLLPGFSIGFQAATLGRSRSTIATYRRHAREAALTNPTIPSLILAQLNALRADDGLQMAQLRGRAQLSHYALLVICEFRERGLSRRQIAAEFRCSPGTVAQALQFRNRSYDALSGLRRLSAVQERPPGQFRTASPLGGCN